jgi:hypothetical protein
VRACEDSTVCTHACGRRQVAPVRIVGLLPLCLTRRSVVRLLDLAELHRNGSVDADATLDAPSRTPVLGVVVRQWGVGEPA